MAEIDKLAHFGGTGKTRFEAAKTEKEYINNLWLAVEDLYTDMYVSDINHKEIRKYILEEVKWNLDKIEEDIENPKSEIYQD